MQPNRDSGKPSTRERYARWIGYSVLAGLTVFAVYELIAADWNGVASFWYAKRSLIPLIVALAALDVALEGAGWMWVAHRFGIPVRDRLGACIFLSAKAGMIAPAQLGRLIRPDALVRTGRSGAREAFKAEAALFALDSLSVCVLLAGLGAMLLHPALTPLAVVIVAVVPLFIASRLGRLLAGTRFDLPPRFWLGGQTFATVAVLAAGWTAHGLAFWALTADLSDALTFWGPLFYAPASAVLGVGSGLPGGVGATEGLLGLSLGLQHVPTAQLVLVVAAFRLVTFWLWIPVGWVALAGIRKRHPREASRSAPAAAGTGPRLAPAIVADAAPLRAEGSCREP